MCVCAFVCVHVSAHACAPVCACVCVCVRPRVCMLERDIREAMKHVTQLMDNIHPCPLETLQLSKCVNISKHQI